MKNSLDHMNGRLETARKKVSEHENSSKTNQNKTHWENKTLERWRGCQWNFEQSSQEA